MTKEPTSKSVNYKMKDAETPFFFIENLSVLCELCGKSFFADSLLHKANLLQLQQI